MECGGALDLNGDIRAGVARCRSEIALPLDENPSTPGKRPGRKSGIGGKPLVGKLTTHPNENT
jgi:hypothetical protein